MAKYRPIFTRIWKDPDFEDLDAVGKLIFIYLCTNELTTDSGIYSISFRTVANETGIPFETVSERLLDGKIKNVIYDPETRYIFVVKFKKYNAGGKPEYVQKGILNDFKLSKQTFLWSCFIKEYPVFKDVILTVGKPLINGSKTVQEQLDNGSKTVQEQLDNGSGTFSTNPNPNPNPNPKKIALFTTVNKAPASRRHFSDRVGKFAPEIIKHCEEILKLPHKGNGQKFNPFQWVQFEVGDNKHPGAIRDAVKALANVKYWNEIQTSAWSYATAIVKTKSGNYREQAHISEAQQFKKIWISPEIQEVIKNIGH